ncbi:MAG: hypothetical protein WC110_09465 [Bacteroidales bacterium]
MTPEIAIGKIELQSKKMAGSNNQNNNSVDYRELVEFFGEQFDKMNAKIDIIIETKADKTNTATKADIDRVLTRIAMINTKIDDYRAEQIATQRQVDNHEKILCKL